MYRCFLLCTNVGLR